MNVVMHVRRPTALALSALILTLSACSVARPTLYPNPQYQKVGGAQAEADIVDCENQAKQYIKTGTYTGPGAAETARNVGVGAAVGGASGAVGGAIWGNPAEGAAAGAAGGATAGLLGTLFGWMFSKSEPDPVYRNFVEKCLRDKGYEPIGWS